MAADDFPLPLSTATCRYCGKPYRRGGRSRGGWFHFGVVTTHRQPDGETRIAGQWIDGDWIDGMPLVLHALRGRRVTITDAQLEPPTDPACEARGQRHLSSGRPRRSAGRLGRG